LTWTPLPDGGADPRLAATMEPARRGTGPFDVGGPDRRGPRSKS